MTDVNKGLIQLWLIRVMFAVVVGTALYMIAHSQSVMQFLGYTLFLVFYIGLCLLWMRVLEGLIEEARDKETGVRMDDLDL